MLSRTKVKSKVDTKYELLCDRGSLYIRETKRSIDIRIPEYLTATQRAGTTKSGLTEHSWKQQQILHNKVQGGHLNNTLITGS